MKFYEVRGTVVKFCDMIRCFENRVDALKSGEEMSRDGIRQVEVIEVRIYGDYRTGRTIKSYTNY